MTGPASVCAAGPFPRRQSRRRPSFPREFFRPLFAPIGRTRQLSARPPRTKEITLRPAPTDKGDHSPPAAGRKDLTSFGPGQSRRLSPASVRRCLPPPHGQRRPLSRRRQKRPHLLRTKRPPPARRGGRRSEQPPRKQRCSGFFMIPPNFSAVFRGSGRRGQVIKPASRLRAPRAACR